MSNRIFTVIVLAVLALGAGACAKTDETASLDAGASASTRLGPDGSEITTTTDANGVKTETRVFKNNRRVSRVVVTTTPDGRRTARVVSTRGEEKEVNDVGDALEVTGDKLADAAGWVADKTEDVVRETGDKLEDVGDKTAAGAKSVGEITVDGAKTVGKKTAKGAKKVGGAIKDAVTP